MERYFDRLLLELHLAVELAMHREGMVNIPAIALEISSRHPQQKMSIVDLEARVLAVAMAKEAVIFFHRPVPPTEHIQA